MYYMAIHTRAASVPPATVSHETMNPPMRYL